MTTSCASHTSHSPVSPTILPANDVAAQSPIAVYSCNRLGRRANPPRSRLADWLLLGRRG